jgi:hypothetical protein
MNDPAKFKYKPHIILSPYDDNDIFIDNSYSVIGQNKGNIIYGQYNILLPIDIKIFEFLLE